MNLGFILLSAFIPKNWDRISFQLKIKNGIQQKQQQ
jgi:hypothetical protein